MFFKEQIKKRIKNEKGLTLIELLAVIVILAIVAAIAIPAIGNIIANSKVKAIKADAANVLSSAKIYYSDGGSSFVIPKDSKGSTDFVDLGNTTAAAEVKVTEDGKISGTLSKDGYSIIFTSATLSNIDIDQAKDGTNIVINKGTTQIYPAGN